MRVSISDTGAGLAPDQVAQLFQAFNRLGQEAGGEEGTGIGLVVAKRLGRRFIGFETDANMVAKATSRIERVVLETGVGVR